MKGWKIFQHSVRQVFGNFDAAMRVSAVLFVVQMAAMFALTGTTLLASEAEQQKLIAAGEFPWLGLVAFLAVTVVSGLWIAVGWHRFVLTNEQPGLLPAFHGDRMWGYFWMAMLLGFLAGFPYGFLLAVVVGGMSLPTVALSVVQILAAVVFGTVLFRLIAVLPGVALRADVRTLTGWEATRGQTGTILLLLIIWSVINFVCDAVTGHLFAANGAAGFAWSVLWLWAQTMVGLSILTTLYGQYVEDRPLA